MKTASFIKITKIKVFSTGNILYPKALYFNSTYSIIQIIYITFMHIIFNDTFSEFISTRKYPHVKLKIVILPSQSLLLIFFL